jgi:diaminohydroxyphosphoribosylaminopyrimidine deaminase/5-amino-6-(5-phosphoribosylamino)uracil reductase
MATCCYLRPIAITPTDEARMGQAMAAATSVRRLVSPRPWVGAVIVPADQPDHAGFEGATDGRTGPHAEVMAIAAAGEAAAGATLYVTLEPCSHHGATGPCADAVIKAGIARVVIGVSDPDPLVAGEGIARLGDAGIEVEVGVCASQVEQQLAPYLHHRRTGRPFVVLKMASTLDGRTAAPDGTSQWITGAEARLDVHRLRADSDAICVGAGTVRSDNPALTVRLPDVECQPGTRDPIRVVLGTVGSDAAVQPCLEMQGDLDAILEDLGSRGVLQLLVEGGATVAHSFHAGGLVDRYVLYMAPALFGGDDGVPLFAGPGATTIEALRRGRIVEMRRVGDDLRLDLEGM